MTTSPTDPVELESMRTSLGGSTDKVPRLLRAGQRVVIVAECVVPKAGEVATKGGVEWQQSLSATEFYVLDDDLGKRVAGTLRAERNLAANASAGVEVLPGFGDLPDIGDELSTDESGVIMTPEEKAAEDAARHAFDHRNDPPESDGSDVGAGELEDYEPAEEEPSNVIELGDRSEPEEPWPGYDELSVKAVKEFLSENADDLDVETLEAIERYESSNKDRAGVAQAIETTMAKKTLPLDDPPLPGEGDTPADVDEFFDDEDE